MVPIYDAANSTDAYLVKNLLEQAGIASYIRGEYLQGGLGDLPVNGMMQVCVNAADAAHARAIVDDWRNAAPTEVDETGDATKIAHATASAKRGFGPLLLAGLLGCALGATGIWALLRAPAAETASDFDNDGVPDERVFQSNDLSGRVETDRNFDGKVDLIMSFGPDGRATRAESDNDFDGRKETLTRYLHNQWQSEEADLNGDGAIDYKADAISGVVYSQQWMTLDGRAYKRVQYERGLPSIGELDTNGDGKFDTRHHYDDSGEIARTEKL